jgi:hypothetical protein
MRYRQVASLDVVEEQSPSVGSLAAINPVSVTPSPQLIVALSVAPSVAQLKVSLPPLFAWQAISSVPIRPENWLPSMGDKPHAGAAPTTSAKHIPSSAVHACWPFLPKKIRLITS